MRYSVHLMFGEAFSEALVELKKYIEKYGGPAISPYFNALLWKHNTQTKETIISVARSKEESENDPFISGIQNLYQVGMEEKQRIGNTERDKHIAAFFKDLFNKTITINKTSDYNELHLMLYIPLFQPEVWEEAKKLIQIIRTLSMNYQIDMIGLAPSTAFLFTKEEDIPGLALRINEYEQYSRNMLADIIRFNKQENTPVANFIFMQNCQQEGVSLQLSTDSFTRIIGELALLSIEQYKNVFLSKSDSFSIKALGLSVLHFDRFYFVNYLLRRTYLYVMDRERVNEQKVDIAKADQIVNEKLEGKTKLVSDFYENEVRPLLHNKSQKQIIVEVTPKLDRLMDEISSDLQSFIDDPNLSLPEKKATLATLLGLDDELLTNYLFDKNQLFIDDLDREATDMYIKANNEIVNSQHQAEAILSIAGEEVRQPLDDLKRIRFDMRQSITYIREKEEEVKKLERRLTIAHEGKKRLIEDGFFVFGDEKFRLLPPELEEIPLADTYTPRKTTITSIDLRSGFTQIKSQGNQGSCSAFTLASIYEYILKTNNALESDLSESFLYYNARKKKGDTGKDNGSNFYDSINALMDSGICTEQLFPYNADVFDKEPGQEAYDDGASRLVKKALNVKTNIDDIRSALAEGYPIAISLRVFDSFSETNGFVHRPSENELKNETSGNHAMVICGYSDEQRLFIIRNSWGTSFGENGYCYIPYSYIGDSSLLNMACIITEVGSGYKTTGDIKSTLEFDTTDNQIEYSILKNLLEEEKYHLNQLVKEDKKLKEKYTRLIQKLGNNVQRNRLIEGLEKKLHDDATAFEVLKEEAMNDKSIQLAAFDKQTRKTGFKIITSILIYTIIAIIVLINFWILIFAQVAWTPVILSVIFIAIALFYFPYRKKKRRLLKEKLDDIIQTYGVKAEKIREEIKTTRMRMHLAGMVLDRLFNLKDTLKNKYYALRSFLGNLTTWYTEESEKLEDMDANTREPFIALLNNEMLDTYFEKNRDQIALDTHLSDFLSSYQVSEEGITVFKKNMKNNIIHSLFKLIEDFSLYNHISGAQNYDYLDNKYVNIPELLCALDEKSRVFAQLTTEGRIQPLHQVIFIKTDTQKDQNQWRSIYPESFSMKPLSQNLGSANKIIILKIQNLDLKHLRFMD
ncbi:MAG: C1 family peptidase [Tannerella sp.]|jgi:hypothetical protein|nr:C1 family peptidase [Tannerella sp.]